MVGHELLERVPRLDDEQVHESAIICRYEILARLLQHAAEPLAGVVYQTRQLSPTA